MHVPVVIPVTCLPFTVHISGVVLVNVTARPDVDSAVTVVFSPIEIVSALRLIAPMLWFPLPTVMLWVAFGAALKPALPAWLAAIVHVPAVMPVAVLPLTLQTRVVVLVKVTGKPEVAVALTVVVPPTTRVAGLKLIVSMLWSSLPTVMFRITCAAAL